MSKRGVKPSVTNQEIDSWIRQYESGMTLLQISMKDPGERSVSTIRKYLVKRIKLRSSVTSRCSKGEVIG